MARRVWFERAFDLGLPPSHQPEIIERLRGTAARLSERVAGLSIEETSLRPGGAWSIAEHAGHLGDLEPLWAGRVEDILEGLADLRAADLENRATWDAGHNDRPIEAVIEVFRDRRTRLIERLTSLDESELSISGLHPRLRQPMTVVDLCYFVAEHDDHHLAAITALRG